MACSRSRHTSEPRRAMRSSASPATAARGKMAKARAAKILTEGHRKSRRARTPRQTSIRVYGRYCRVAGRGNGKGKKENPQENYKPQTTSQAASSNGMPCGVIREFSSPFCFWRLALRFAVLSLPFRDHGSGQSPLRSHCNSAHAPPLIRRLVRRRRPLPRRPHPRASRARPAAFHRWEPWEEAHRAAARRRRGRSGEPGRSRR